MRERGKFEANGRESERVRERGREREGGGAKFEKRMIEEYTKERNE